MLGINVHCFAASSNFRLAAPKSFVYDSANTAAQKSGRGKCENEFGAVKRQFSLLRYRLRFFGAGGAFGRKVGRRARGS